MRAALAAAMYSAMSCALPGARSRTKPGAAQSRILSEYTLRGGVYILIQPLRGSSSASPLLLTDRRYPSARQRPPPAFGILDITDRSPGRHLPCRTGSQPVVPPPLSLQLHAVRRWLYPGRGVAGALQLRLPQSMAEHHPHPPLSLCLTLGWPEASQLLPPAPRRPSLRPWTLP